jgi:PilZ domain
MRRLREQQDVTLLVGATQLRCRVVAINSDEAALKPFTAPRVSRQELEGAASLMFAHRGSFVALKGRASWGEVFDDLRFTVRDGVQVPQQRSSSRLQIPLDALVNGQTGRSIDISADGMSLQGGTFGDADTELDIELEIPDHEPPLRVHGRVVRATTELTAVRFDDIPDADRDRLSRFIFAVQRMLASGELRAG